MQDQGLRTAPKPAATPRIIALDLARTVALVAMAIFHSASILKPSAISSPAVW
jgi:uncharacterized membrane protein